MSADLLDRLRQALENEEGGSANGRDVVLGRFVRANQGELLAALEDGPGAKPAKKTAKRSSPALAPDG